MTESALKRRNYVVSTVLTFGVQLKALSLIYGVSFFTFRIATAQNMHWNFSALVRMFQHGFFFSFKCKSINFCQSSLAEMLPLGKALCIFTRKEAESELLHMESRYFGSEPPEVEPLMRPH